MLKQCTRCKTQYPTGRNFYRDAQKSDGLTSQCKRCIRETRIDFYDRTRAKRLEYSRKHYQEHKEQRKKRANDRRRAKVVEIFTKLGDKCSICGFDNNVALQIDHINGGGYRHRKVSGGGETYYCDILRNISSFRLLCANCNFIQGVKNNHRTSIWN